MLPICQTLKCNLTLILITTLNMYYSCSSGKEIKAKKGYTTGSKLHVGQLEYRTMSPWFQCPSS